MNNAKNNQLPPRDFKRKGRGANGTLAINMKIANSGTGFLDRFRPPVMEKRHTLDELGSFVVGRIDGRRNVKCIIDDFVERYRVNRREAELSVVAFLKMLMHRHIVSIVAEKG